MNHRDGCPRIAVYGLRYPKEDPGQEVRSYASCSPARSSTSRCTPATHGSPGEPEAVQVRPPAQRQTSTCPDGRRRACHLRPRGAHAARKRT
eukprot:7783001-Pyramimonas_sp.AAC.1